MTAQDIEFWGFDISRRICPAKVVAPLHLSSVPLKTREVTAESWVPRTLGATDLGSQTSLGLLNIARAQKMRDLLPEESHVTVKGKALGLHHSHTQAKL